MCCTRFSGFTDPQMLFKSAVVRVSVAGAHVMNLRFTQGDRYVITVGGNDRAIMEWRYHNRPPSTPDASVDASEVSAAMRRSCGRGEDDSRRGAWR